MKTSHSTHAPRRGTAPGIRARWRRAPQARGAACLKTTHSAHARRGAHGGGRGIRTPDTLSGTTVFKTAAINRSAIPPQSRL